MKMKIIAGAGILLLAIALLFALKPKSFAASFEKEMDDVSAYLLQGSMEVTKGEDVKTYALEIGFKKGEPELFKVSLTDKELNQEQVILRNKEGVFVVTPSLNQIFKFEGDWPMNSPKPYLLQTIRDIVLQEGAQVSKEQDGYLVSSKVSYPSSKSYHHEEIKFDKKHKLQWLQIFNEDNVAELKIVFSKADYQASFDKDYFATPTNVEKKAGTSMISEADLPLYPAQVFSAKLESSDVMQANGETRHILEYAGEKSFTVIETKKQANSETQTVIMPGEMVDTLDLVGFYDGSHMSAVYDNVEFSVYSQDLGPEEMLQVINSMQVAVMK